MISFLYRESLYLAYYCYVQLLLIAPYWLIGIGAGSLLSVFAKDKIHKAAAKAASLRNSIVGIIAASLLGIASPLCMYGTIPLAASFAEKGVRDEWLAAFMTSSMLLNPQLFLYSTALGGGMAALRFTGALLSGVGAGLLLHLFYAKAGAKAEAFFLFKKVYTAKNRDTHPNPLWRFVCNVGRNIRVTAPYFAVGIALTALYQRYVPRTFIGDLSGGKTGGLGVLFGASIGIPLYMCGGGTIAIIHEWLQSGMSRGSALAFMLTGPATKLTNLGALKITLGSKHFLIYLLYIFSQAIISGVVTDLLFM